MEKYERKKYFESVLVSLLRMIETQDKPLREWQTLQFRDAIGAIYIGYFGLAASCMCLVFSENVSEQLQTAAINTTVEDLRIDLGRLIQNFL